MKPLLWLSSIFINTFGITQPSQEAERRIALLIAGLLLLVVLAVSAFALVLRASFHA